VGNIAGTEEMTDSYEIFVRKPEGDTPPARPMRTWEDNIKMIVKETACVNVGWIHLAQVRDK
jgi:hypothetical protein